MDVVGLGEQMDRRLTVEQEEVRADGTARHLGCILSKDGAVGIMKDLPRNKSNALLLHATSWG